MSPSNGCASMSSDVLLRPSQTKNQKQDLGDAVWEVVGVKVKVAQHCRYLGAQISTRSELATEKMNNRLERATSMTKKLAGWE